LRTGGGQEYLDQGGSGRRLFSSLNIIRLNKSRRTRSWWVTRGRNTYKISVGKPACRWEDITEMDLKEDMRMWKSRDSSVGIATRLLAGRSGF
jgi:hypothetical protein